MKNFWNKMRQFFKKVGGWFVAAWKAIASAVKRFGRWVSVHWRAAVICAAAVVLALGVFLALFLTLPVKTVEIEGEVLLLQGEEYSGGLNVKATTKAGLVHRESVLPKMLSGFDPDSPGEQTVTVSYGKRSVKAKITVLALTEVSLRVREGTMPADYEPNDPFPKSGVFDVYYGGELIRSAPIGKASAPGFSTRLSGNYEIFLNYKTGLSIPYQYRVLEVIQSIVPVGVLYAKQGESLTKQSAMGNLRFHVTYKDGTEEDVMIYDDRIFVQQGALDVRDADYQGAVTFSYKGVEIECPVTAYKGELLAPRKVTLHTGNNVYVVGETFDYASSYLEVEYERFGGTPVLLRATEETVLLMERQGDPENHSFTPITDGSAPIVFDQVQYYHVAAKYLGVESAVLTLRVIAQEDVGLVTDLTTTWRGRNDGPPAKGQDLDFEDAVLTVEYGYGYRTEEVPLVASMVTGYDKTVAGDQTLTVTYKSFQNTLKIRVSDPGSNVVTHIYGVVGWDEPTYYSSDELVVPAGAYLEVEIGYGASRANVPLTDDEVTISGFTPHDLEVQELTITYKGLTITMPLTVRDDRTEQIVDFWAPREIHVNVGDSLDLSGECVVFYSTGRQVKLTLAEVLGAGGTMSGSYDINTAGTYPVRYYYPGFGSTDHATWIYVEGEAAVLATGIRLDVSDGKTAYIVGESLAITGMKLYLVYSNGGEEDVTAYLTETLFKGFSTAQAGNFTATVTYLSEGGSFATGYDYSVS